MTPSSPIAREEQFRADGPLVLVVDDNERNLRLARDVLRAAGFRTLEATTGGDALELADRELPDVVLLDLGLPDIHGTAVARTLRDAERTARIPLVAVPSQPLEGGDWHVEAGFDGYVEKPFDVGTFPDLVRGYCGTDTG